MIAVRGIYDGEKVRLLESLPKDKKYKVVITFLEEYLEEDEIRDFASQDTAFDFWHDEKEDLYQD
jgi:hypothetical protein